MQLILFFTKKHILNNVRQKIISFQLKKNSTGFDAHLRNVAEKIYTKNNFFNDHEGYES